MEVKINRPKPVEPPPNTVDILGLSERQASLLMRLVGRTAGGEFHDLYHVLKRTVPHINGCWSECGNCIRWYED